MHRRTFRDVVVAGVAGYAVRPGLAIAAQPSAWHERLPKIELHVHLEGAIPRATSWELATNTAAIPPSGPARISTARSSIATSAAF